MARLCSGRTWQSLLGPTHIASADFNSDGRRDLVVGNTDDARIYLNNGAGFTAGVYYQ